ncbi:transcriptional regulator [Mycolicibacterium agri]|uniref:Transcriptional regulator n=1 Tax=Mycolicibacterium agri TaxID=36811 RepID=A0A2A7MWP1_MYCAG|nr:transcriptional regulator [Mycolicibacterium agri]GFG54255.1 putative transcriptional regulator, MarR family protein [Mycolicibacterium agri]
MVSVKTKSALISDITELIGAVGDKFSADESDAERDYIAQRCPRRLEPVVRTLPKLSVHLLAGIAEGPISLVGLASRSGQLKGTVSKHVRRLVDAGLVVRSPVPGNRKEIELRLTSDGELVAEVHRQMHEEIAAGLRDFLSRYTNAELAVLTEVLADLMTARKVGVRLTPGD